MYELTIEETRQLLNSYDEEIARQEKSLAAVKALRCLVASKLEAMEIANQDQAHGFGG